MRFVRLPERPDFAAVLDEAKRSVDALPASADRFGITWREVDFSEDELRAQHLLLDGAFVSSWFEPDGSANRLPVDLGVSDPEDVNRVPEESLPYVCLVTPRPEGDFGPTRRGRWLEDARHLRQSANQPISQSANQPILPPSSYLSDNNDELAAAWNALAIPDPVPSVDFDREVDWVRFDTIEPSPAGDRREATATDFLYPFGCMGVGGLRRFVVAASTTGLQPAFSHGDLTV